MGTYTTNGRDDAALTVLASATGKTAAVLVKEMLSEGIRSMVYKYSSQISADNKKICKPFLK